MPTSYLHLVRQSAFIRNYEDGRLPKRILVLECGHKRLLGVNVRIPSRMFCQRCKELETNKVLQHAMKQQVDIADPTRVGIVCRHGTTACKMCGTSKQNITEVKIGDIPF